MEKHVKEIMVFRGKRVTRGQDSWCYLRQNGGYNGNWVEDPLQAKDYANESPAAVVRALEVVSKNSDAIENAEFVSIKITTEIEAIDVNDGEIMEERRRQALAKLNPLEVEALGLEKLASYNKLKFHGSK